MFLFTLDNRYNWVFIQHTLRTESQRLGETKACKSTFQRQLQHYNFYCSEHYTNATPGVISNEFYQSLGKMVKRPKDLSQKGQFVIDCNFNVHIRRRLHPEKAQLGHNVLELEVQENLV